MLSIEALRGKPFGLRSKEPHDPAKAEARREDIVVGDIVRFLEAPAGQRGVKELPGDPYPKTDPSHITDKNGGLPVDKIAEFFGAEVAEAVSDPTPPLDLAADIYVSKPTNPTTGDIANPK